MGCAMLLVSLGALGQAILVSLGALGDTRQVALGLPVLLNTPGWAMLHYWCYWEQ